MENGAVHEEPEVQSMETVHEPVTVELTSFTESIEEIYLWKMIKIWPQVESALERHGLSGTLNQDDLSVTVSTTARTTDPHIIRQAWGCIVLVSQAGFPKKTAITGLDGEDYYDYIKTGYQEGGLAAIHGIDKEQYIKKRKCLFKHLKELAEVCWCAIKILDQDSIAVAGATLRRIRRFRNAVESCILENIDPGTHAKKLDDKYRYLRLMSTIKNLKI